ncbi:MAG TPA: hypothetical protein VNW06_03765 [Cytophagaceae bacterium]|jgi:hypothetical protein|nr:hypothetical protein [Cytophagaceae bacterium]
MEDNKDDIEDIFRDRFSQEEAPVAPRVWDNIKKTLPKENAGGSAVDYVKKYFLFGLIGVVFVAGAVLLVSKSYIKNEDNKKEVGSGNDIVVSEEPKNKGEETLKENNEYKDRIENNRLENEKLSVNGNSNYSNDSSSDKAVSTTLTASNKTNKNSNGQNSFLKNVVPSNNKIDKSNENGNLKNAFAVNNSKANKTNKNNQNLSTTVTSNDNLKKLNKKELSKNTLSEKSPVANNSLSKINKKNNIQNSNTTNVSSLNKSKADSNRIGNNKNENQNFISFANKNVNKIDSNNSGKDEIRTIDTENNKIKKTTTAIDTNLVSTKQKNAQRLLENKTTKDSVISPKIDQSLLATNLTKLDTLSITTKDKQDNEQQLAQNKVRRDSAISSTIDSMLVIDPILIAGADSLKKLLPDSIVSKISDSTTVEEKKKKDKNKIEDRWSFDLLLSPMLTGATTKYLGTDTIVKSNVDSKNKQDRNRLDFSAGGMLNYSIHPRVSLSVGVIYSRYSESNKFKNSISHDSTYYQHTVDTSGKADSVKVTKSTTNKYASTKIDHYNFLSFPINISYVLFNKTKLSLSVTAGIKVNMLLNGVTYIRNASNTDLVEVSGNFHKVTLSYMASMGIEYKLKARMSLLAQPIVNFNMSSVYDRSLSLSQKPYSFGVNIGLRFKF